MKTISLRQIKHVLTNHLGSSVAFSKSFALLSWIAVLALPNLAMGQAGSLDPTFGTNGIVTTANTSADAAALQSDGKILVAGTIVNPQNSQQGGLLRYNTNGTLDSSFGTGGKVFVANGGSQASNAFAVAIQTDGKILTAAPDSLHLTVFRLNTDGSPDTTFGSNGAVTIQAAGLFLSPQSGGLALQSDGKIVVVTGHVVARLLANGQLDTTFGSNGAAATVGGNSVTLMSNGQILIGLGSITSLYAANGSLVAKFGISGQTPGFPFDSEGGFVVITDPISNVTKIISVGSLVTSPSLIFGETVSGFLLMRYNIDGTVDNSFAIHGGVATPFPGNIFSRAFAVAAQANGDIVVSGQTAMTDVGGVPGPSDFGLVRYHSTGKIDTTFGSGGFVSTPFGSSEAFANSVLIQTDGKIVAVGASNSGTTIARYLGN